MRKKLGLAAHEHEVICVLCGKRFETTYAKALYCSRSCKDIATGRARQAVIDAAKPDRHCAWCGIEMPRKMRADARFCSEQCNSAAHNVTRKMAKRTWQAPLWKGELVNRNEIVRRSHGRCGICGGSVDITRAHPDPLAPSIDHILPLSRGGTNEPKNLQLAHLRCNLAKGA